MTDNRQEIEPKGEHPVAFRDDLRPPVVTWGRCMLTGEFGPVVGLDPGEIAIDCPNTEKGVEYDPDTKAVTFTVWEPQIIEQQMTLSKAGLQHLLAWMENQELPIPSVTPHLVYQWQVLYTDGSLLCQFGLDPVTGAETETNSREIDYSRIGQISVVARPGNEISLPTYTFVPETGKFFCGGQDVDVSYPYGTPLPADLKPFYCRKVTVTWGSVIGESLSRNVQNAHTTVLQVLGWRTWDGGPECLIAIDERGNWRPWRYA